MKTLKNKTWNKLSSKQEEVLPKGEFNQQAFKELEDQCFKYSQLGYDVTEFYEHLEQYRRLIE